MESKTLKLTQFFSTLEIEGQKINMHVHIEDVLPFTPWLRRYNRHYLKADLFAGLTVVVVALPQSMAYAIIAGLPVEYGLYASIVSETDR